MRCSNLYNLIGKGSALLLILWANVFFLFSQEAVSFPYKLNTERETVLVSGGSAVLGFALILKANKPHLSNKYIESLDKDKLNSIDFSAAGQWSERANSSSNILRTSMLVTPVLLIVPEFINKEYKNGFTLLAMYSEVLLINGGVTLLTKNTINRPRPYIYNSDLSTGEKLQQREPFSSFFSGHTSFSFCSAVFLSKVFSDLYPESEWKYVVWSSSLFVASTTAYLRYKSGMHYPTDVLVGAVVGSAIGFLIPVLHKSNNNNASTDPSAHSPAGFSLKMNF